MPTMTYRYLICLTGIILAPPILVLTTLAFTLSITFSGIGYLAACALVILGFILAPWMPKHHLWLTLAGGIIFFLIAGIRVFIGEQNTDSNLKMITLPQGTRWISYLIDEQDGLIFGEELFHLIGGDSTREHQNLVSAFQAAYLDMHTQGIFPSPLVDTYLNLQQPNAFDAVLIEPKGQPKFAVIFLHGYMGNVTAQCWEIAQAIKELGGLTLCPSTEWTGEWWQPNGLEILNNTFAYLRNRGISKLYLGGFSNGGISIGYLASELSKQQGLLGLFLIDGFTNGSDVRSLGLPVLMIEGSQDERIPPPVAHQFAAEVGSLGTYVEIDSDHFLIMKQPDLVQDALTIWLDNQISDP